LSNDFEKKFQLTFAPQARSISPATILSDDRRDVALEYAHVAPRARMNVFDPSRTPCDRPITVRPGTAGALVLCGAVH
jgi:hypothetical protein